MALANEFNSVLDAETSMLASADISLLPLSSIYFGGRTSSVVDHSYI